MPTKSNNIGGRGGARPGAGRRKSAIQEKAASGNPGGRKLSDCRRQAKPQRS